MTSKTLSTLVGLRYETIARRTKKALEAGEFTLSFDGVVYVVEVVHSARGKSYEYHEQKSDKKATMYSHITLTALKELKEFDIFENRPSAENKALLVHFYLNHKYSLKSIINGLYDVAFKIPTDKERQSLERKFRHWINKWKKEGKMGLLDTRGKSDKVKTIDYALVKKCAYAVGSKGIRKAIYQMHFMYAYQKNMELSGVCDHNIKPESVVSYSGFSNALSALKEEDAHLKIFLSYGWDGLLQARPVGVRDISYINQEWQVDATTFDFMCHVLHDDGTSSIKRMFLTAVRDSYSGVSVATLTQSLDSYAQVRVLYKSFELMGVPEMIKMDNGQDYTSYHYTDLLDDVGIENVKARVGQGREKGSIERFFGVLQGKLSLLPGYIGNDVKKRKEIEDQYASKIDVRTSKKTRIPVHRLLTSDELQIMIDGELADKALSYEAFEHFRGDKEELQSIYRRLGKKHSRRLSSEGIKIANVTYQGVDIWMTGLTQRTWLNIYENIDNTNEIFVYHADKYLGVAKNIELKAEAMTQEEQKTMNKAYAKTLKATKKTIKDAEKMMEEFQDSNVAYRTGAAASYTIAKPTPKPKEPKPVQNNSYYDQLIEEDRA
ncbi:MAG: hypothetical protein Q9M36_05615 [Sulfurovum sp.]|nr:hypothetical protein [Sulfurovum sp.]